MTVTDPVENRDGPQPQEKTGRCGAKNREGQPCQKPPLLGGVRCILHGGGSPQARRKAAENLLMQKALKLIPDPDDRPRLTDPIGKLRELAEEAEAVKDMLAVTVNALESIGYRGGLMWDEDGRLSGVGTEQTRVEWAAYEKALERQQKFLLDIAKLDLDTRWLAIEAWHQAQISGATLLVLQGMARRLGLDWDDQAVRLMLAEELRALPAVIDP